MFWIVNYLFLRFLRKKIKKIKTKFMEDLLKNSYELTKWLNLLINERISEDINIKIDKNLENWIIFSSEFEGYFEILISENFYKLGYQNDFIYKNISLENPFFDTKDKKLPAPGFSNDSLFNFFQNSKSFKCNYDIFGLAFWMMNRLEELFLEDKYKDKHGRFDFRHSHAYKFGYLSRPIVDEWLIFLSQLIKYVFPNCNLKKSKFKISPTHDVDNPRKYSLISRKRILKNSLRTLFINPFEVFYFLFFRNLFVFKKLDPYDNFKWILNISEKYNLKNEFYFMVSGLNWRFDTGYKINNPKILKLIIELKEKGHNIGLHPSYDTDLDNFSLKQQSETLKNFFSKNQFSQDKIGSRMHYLRFFHPKTSYQCLESQITYDSSLGYAAMPGFRCGTCREFILFDAVQNKTLELKERPLILMESSLFSKETFKYYRNLNPLEIALKLKNKCIEVNGEFLFLWHNCQLDTKSKRDLYEILVRTGD